MMCSALIRLTCLAYLASLWLCVGTAETLIWQSGAGFRAAELKIGQTGKTGFSRLDSRATGILFSNVLSDERAIRNRNLVSGSGVAAGDVDGDGLCDLYFCRLGGPNVLYRNVGHWRFEDITSSAGVACPKQDSMGAVLGDINGDGALDLLVSSLGNGVRIFENDSHGHFKEVTDQTGVRSKTGSMSMALADVDGDGDLDLYVANYRPDTIRDQPTTTFRIQVINGIPLVAQVNGEPATSPELTNRFVVSPSGEVLEFGEVDVLYLNDGQGKFTPVSFTDGSFLDEEGKPLAEPPRDWGLSVHFCDLNGDGAPDIYVCNDLFTPDRIWINDGQGKFRALDRLALRNTSYFSMGMDCADIDRDGNVDLFIVDMFSPNHLDRMTQVAQLSPVLWPIGLIDNRPQFRRNTLQINRGDGTFAETAWYSGVEASDWSWGPIFLDVDLDGYEDILVVNGQLADFQNADMDHRIEVTRRSKRLTPNEIADLVRLFPRLLTPNRLFRNRGDLTFDEVGAAWGFGDPGISQGMALADLDNDGDMDVVVNNLNGPAGIYRNDGVAPRIAVRLKGRPPNTQGIGAQIKVTGGPIAQSQEIICGGRYLSGDDPMRVFAAGTLSNRLTIEVTWRSGQRSVVNEALPNHVYEVHEAGVVEIRSPKPQVRSAEGLTSRDSQTGSHQLPVTSYQLPVTSHQLPVTSHQLPVTSYQLPVASHQLPVASHPTQAVFQDVSELLGHTHADEPFDDFERQPLLLNRLSQLGPGVAWHDVDGDGWDDLIIGTGRGGHLGLYRNNGRGGFTSLAEAPVNRQVGRDQTSVLGVGSTLFVGSANYEDGTTNGGRIAIYDLNRKASGESLLGPTSSTGPLALADVDNDGDLDLFVGGRCGAGRYPDPATSLLVKNEGGKLMIGQRWEKLGLVSGAVFSDLNGDGLPELILACDWGQVRVMRNEGGSFKEVTQELGLADFKGWWNGVTTGDLDGDGRLDIIASNWGLNSKHRTSRAHPRRLYYGDLDGNGTVDLVEARYDESMGKEVPQRGLTAVGMAIPFVREKITTYEAYGSASVEDIYGEKLKGAGVLEANTLASMVFFNRGDRFEGKKLPLEAQLTPAFGVCVGDMDGDGNEDVFLSQNFFATNPETARNDAGRGLWLRGDGKGGLRAVEGQDSGVEVYGEQRGCALGDYDGDGRVDLVVTQNGNATKLYHNVQARPGLRVKLKGSPGNSTGVGAVMRLIYDGKQGPVREVHAGSGYWSQDSAVQVLALAGTPTRIWVRWPGGKTTEGAIPANAKEISVPTTGQIERIR